MKKIVVLLALTGTLLALTNEGPLFISKITVTPPSCELTGGSEISVEAMGGEKPYIFELIKSGIVLETNNNGTFTDELKIDPSDQSPFEVKVTDASGLSENISYPLELTPFALITYTISPVCRSNGAVLEIMVEGVANTTLDIAITQDGVSIDPSVGQSQNSITVSDLQPGNYTITISNSNVECNSTELSFSIKKIDPIIESIETLPANTDIVGGTINATVFGLQPITHKLKNIDTDEKIDNGNNNIFTQLEAGTYLFTATIGQGCEATKKVTILPTSNSIANFLLAKHCNAGA